MQTRFTKISMMGHSTLSFSACTLKTCNWKVQLHASRKKRAYLHPTNCKVLQKIMQSPMQVSPRSDSTVRYRGTKADHNDSTKTTLYVPTLVQIMSVEEPSVDHRMKPLNTIQKFQIPASRGKR